MIHQIQIQNFKSLRNVTVDLSPVTVFIGKSGTGKTNFASAIRFLRDYLLHGPKKALQSQLNSTVRCLTNPDGATRFTVVFDVPGFENQFTYSLEFANNFNVVQSESLDNGIVTVFKQGADKTQGSLQWIVPPALVSVPQAGPSSLGRLPGIEEASIAFTVLTDAIGVYAFPYDVFNNSAQQNATSGSGFVDNGQNFLEVIGNIARNLYNSSVRKAIVASLRQVNSSVASVDLDSNQNPQKAYVGHRFEDKVLPLELAQESDGFRRFYAHLLALYQLPPKQVSVFEEPENGIYPGALSLLADEFRSAPEAGRGQVLLTTHSLALLDGFSADQIRVVELVNLETQIRPLVEEQRVVINEHLLHSGELLTVDPARGQ